ncbi:MAG: S8 family serine peptidase [Pikeienuella sp.]|uniref:S8 family serine peptidase n=1 Tax=Pikeienuella sp. TaxID=2831957 RepID=UPI0039198CFE
MHVLSLPLGQSVEAALAAARNIAPEAVFDQNDLYDSGAGACAGEECWGAQFVSLDTGPADACTGAAPIAIIDTAVDLSHPSLRGARIEQASFLTPGLSPAPPDHGTAVAALLVGEAAPGMAPLAPGARLLSAAAFAQRGEATRADAAALIRALDWALAEGARVVGMSIAGEHNILLGRALDTAGRRANIVAAAGNAGPGARAAFPAALPSVIAVSAVDRRKRAWRGGNRGPYVEFAAPGVNVASAAPDGGSQGWTGTSFAVPFAVAALLRARGAAGGDPEAARALLVRGAEDLGAPGRDEETGFGLIRAPGGRCR